MQERTVYATRSTESVLATNKVLRNTYMLLGMTLAFSALTAGLSMALNLPHPGLIITLVAFYGLLFGIEKTKNGPMGLVLTFALTGFMGLTLGPILTAYLNFIPNGGQLIMTALGGTALTFFGLSAYVLTTKKDMSFLGGMMMAGFIALLVMFVANLFLAIPALSMALSVMFILFSSGVILMQTSAIIHGGETNYVSATVSLYVALYNIFLSLLSLLGMGGDD